MTYWFFMEDKESYTHEEFEEGMKAYAEIVSYRYIISQTSGDAKEKALEINKILYEKFKDKVPEEIQKTIKTLDKRLE